MELEKDAYNPGETARGTLLINADKKVKARKLIFSAYGKERYEERGGGWGESWTEKYDIFFVEDLSPFLKSIITYSDNDDDTIAIPQGSFTIPFHFSVPQNSLGSYQGVYVAIHYEVRVDVDIGPWKKGISGGLLFEVTNPTIPYTFSGDIFFLGEENKRKEDKPFLDLQLDKTNGISGIPCYSPGETINGKLKPENISAEKIRKAVIQLHGVEHPKWGRTKMMSAKIKKEIEYENKMEDIIVFGLQIPPNAKRSYNAKNSEHYWLFETKVDISGSPDIRANKIIQIA